MHCGFQLPTLSRLFCYLGFLATPVVLSVASTAAAQAPEFDIIIRHGRIVDGSGNPWYRGDLGIRGKRIAARMDCPCGCDKRVADCTCNTATKIKKALATAKFEGQSDAQIMMALNKRFCMGSM